MSFIYLNPIVNKKVDTNSEFPYKQLESLLLGLKDKLGNMVSITVSEAISDDNRRFSDVKFVISSVFHENGNLYYSDGTFALNITSLLEQMRILLSEESSEGDDFE